MILKNDWCINAILLNLLILFGFLLQRGTKAITSIDYSSSNRTIVTGNTDRHIRLWDPRCTGSYAIINKFFYDEIFCDVVYSSIQWFSICFTKHREFLSP